MHMRANELAATWAPFVGFGGTIAGVTAAGLKECYA